MTTPHWIASPALKGTIVLAQCRSWLLSEEESHCRNILNHINSEKHTIKTNLNQTSENMQKQCTTFKSQLNILKSKEDTLRSELDTSSGNYIRLYRDPNISRGNDEMLSEKQRSNELWNELEKLIYERNELTTNYTALEATNLCIIQNLYQTQVLLQTQQEKQRQHGLYGMDMGEEEEGGSGTEEDGNNKSAAARRTGKSKSTGPSSHAPKPHVPLALAHSSSILGSSSASASSKSVKSSAADSPSTTPFPAALNLIPISPLDQSILDSVSKLNSLRNAEITAQKRLSKFLALREQVQAYLIKIAGFQKKLWQQQQQTQYGTQMNQRNILRSVSSGSMSSASNPGSGRASPSMPSSPPRSIVKSTSSNLSVANENHVTQPIPILAAGDRDRVRKNSCSGANSVFDPNYSTPTDGQIITQLGSTNGSSGGSNSLLSSSSQGSSTSESPSSPSSPSLINANTASNPSSRATASSTSPNAASSQQHSAAAPASILVKPRHPQPGFTSGVPSQPPSLPFNAERDAREKTQLANLVFDARNRKVLQRITEHFQKSGLISNRRYKKSTVSKAFLGVEMLTWVLNIGISSMRNDALILLELLLRAGLIDMIQEQEPEKVPASLAHEDGTISSLRINDRSLFGDMKLQFALYRLRGDSSEIGALSKSGWLFKVARWRVHKRYFSWDVDVHRLGMFNSNKDETPARVYYLGASTIIQQVESQEAGSSSSNGSGSSRSQFEPVNKFYFQLHFNPPQNDESSLLLYAPSERERGEWIKVLWLSGCEYPSLGKHMPQINLANLNTNNSTSDKHGSSNQLVAPGSRPNPIHPSILTSPGHGPGHGGQGHFAGSQQNGLASPNMSSPMGASDSEDEGDEDFYYEESTNKLAADESSDCIVDEPRRRYAADESMDPSGGARSQLSSISPSGVGLSSSASFSGSIGNSKRRLSLMDKKNESDLMGIFSLKRAKNKFGFQAALNKLQRNKQRTHAHTNTTTATPAIVEGLDLGWKELFDQNAAAATATAIAVSTTTEPTSSTSSQSAPPLLLSASVSASASSTPSSTLPLSSDDSKSETESDSSIPHSGSGGGLHLADTNSEDNDFATGSGVGSSARDDEQSDSDDSASDYNSEDEFEEAGLEGEWSLTDLVTSTSPAQESAAAPTMPSVGPAITANTLDVEAQRTLIRRQKYASISTNLSSILSAAAPILASPPPSTTSSAPHSGISQNSSSSSSHDKPAPIHPLTGFLVTFARQFNDLYSGSLELEGGPLSGQHNRSSSSGSHAAWPTMNRTGSTESKVPSDSESSTTPLTASHTSNAAPYPFPRHARAVLQSAKEDVRLFLHAMNTLIGETLHACETLLRSQLELERRKELSQHDSGTASSDLITSSASTAAALKSRRKSIRNDPILRRVEREFILLTRLCSQLVTHHTFLLIHRTLFPLYTIVTDRKDSILTDAIQTNKELTFKEMGLSEELIFSAGENSGSSGSSSVYGISGDEKKSEGNAISYQHAIDTFRSLSSLASPIDKLQCVVSVAKAICACVDQAKQAQVKLLSASSGSGSAATSSPVVIGADDLLLLFTYLLLRGSVPHLMSELSFLSDFIPEHQRPTMRGYYLATTQAATELLMSEEFKATIQQREGSNKNKTAHNGNTTLTTMPSTTALS